MKASELKRIVKQGGVSKVVKAAPVPEPREVVVKLESEPQVVEVGVEATVDVQELMGQVANLTATINDLVAERDNDFDLIVVRSETTGKIRGVRKGKLKE